jgi:hypothetical protein
MVPVETPPSVPERIEFWLKLHDRLGSSPTGSMRRRKARSSVRSTRVSTADEQRALQLARAEEVVGA